MDMKELERPWWLLPPGRLHWMWWIVAGAACIWIDYADEVYTQFPLLYVIPMCLAAWYSGRWPAIAMAVTVPIAHLIFQVWAGAQTEGTMATLVVRTILRVTVVVILALWLARLSKHEQALKRYVQRLEGLLPICSFCKNIRNDKGRWEPIETYISDRSEAQFSHGLCPDCGKKHYPDYDLSSPATSHVN